MPDIVIELARALAFLLLPIHLVVRRPTVGSAAGLGGEAMTVLVDAG
jgi:hypothetical protein